MEKSLIPKTNVIITCWNALEYTKVTLSRLFETVEHNFYLTIINNGSTDGTAEYLGTLSVPANCRELSIITNTENLGPGAAVNQGYAVSKRLGVGFSCLCNNDLYFQSGWLEQLEKTMAGDERVGILGPLRPATSVKHYKGMTTVALLKSTPEDYDWRDELKFFTGLPLEHFDEAAERIVQVNGKGQEVLDVPPEAISSCCVLVRNRAVEADDWIADPRFTTYGGEDMDMTWTIASRGYKCVILKDVYVHHFRSKSIKASGLDRQAHVLEGNKKFFAKWRNTIYDFLQNKAAEGADLGELLNIESDNGYWFLHRLNRDIQFWSDGNIDEENFKH